MTILQTMLAALSLYRASSFNLGHQRLLSRIYSPRIINGARCMTTKDEEQRVSVSGTVYSCDDDSAPVVTLFTKDGCTLCDKVKDVRNPLCDFLMPLLVTCSYL